MLESRLCPHGCHRIGLVGSMFPGIDLLGRAFEEEMCENCGNNDCPIWCVVRGPDVIWGGDVTQAPVLTDALLARLKRTGNWMVRFSEDGIAYGGYRWPEIGAWAEAPDWNPDAVCGGGFHGQGPGGYGYCQGGSRFELCETKGHRVIVDGNKVKVRHARILAVDGEAWTAIMALCDTEFPGSLYCRGYGHPLPALKSVGGSLYCSGYAHPLPALQSVGRAAAQRRGPGREWRQMP